MTLHQKALIIADFINFCAEALDIKELPKMKFTTDKNWVLKRRTFGEYTNETKSLIVYIKHRNICDTLRTLSHELTHHKQNELGLLGPNSGETGSDFENNSNEIAGIILREYGKINPLIYENKVIKNGKGNKSKKRIL